MKKHILLFTLLTLLAFTQMVWGQASVTYSSSDTWICPAGVTTVSVECWGGGGPGGNGKGFLGRTGMGGGGAGGAYARSTINVTPGTSYTVTVGAQQASGLQGNPSWFSSSSTVFAEGGAQGNPGTATISSNKFGTGGTGSKSSSIGTVTFKGGDGYTSSSTTVSTGGGGSAGNASNGISATSATGAAAVTGGGAGGNGASGHDQGGTQGSLLGPGGGGGGAWAIGSTNQGGGFGAAGQVKLTYCNPATAVSAIGTGSGSGTISWTAPASYDNTNNETIVFLKNGSPVTEGTPSNNISAYTANTVFGSGTTFENDASAYCIYKGDGTSVDITGITNGATYYALVFNTNSINGSTVYSTGSTTNGVLPVELTSFSASLAGNSVSLYWNTATEVNNYGFNVERSVQSQESQKIAFIKGHGNSNSPKSYSFVDVSAPVGNVTYTLVQIDYDGTSKIIGTTQVTVVAPSTYALKQNYPNPFNPATSINYELPKSSHVTLKVYNLLGQEVASLVNTTQNAGSYSVNFSTNSYGMSSGIYFYRLDTGNYSEMKKMAVIK